MTDTATTTTDAGEFRIKPADDEAAAPGAHACFPYDRALVERFRDAFPRARWREAERCWWVPGARAAERLDRWVTGELAALDRHADDKGRDAYAFDPLPRSRYLDVGGDDLVVRTPYSRTVVETMRSIPWARWDPAARAWRVPFRSYEALRARWPGIEEAARRNEPEVRRQRAEEQRRDEAAMAQVRERERERRRHRFPVPLSHPPLLEQPVATEPFGVIVFTGTDGEVIEAADVPALYRHAHAGHGVGPFAWLSWRLPTWRELAAATPAETPANPDELGQGDCGWRLPTRADLQERRRTMRRSERAQASRAAAAAAGHDAAGHDAAGADTEDEEPPDATGRAVPG